MIHFAVQTKMVDAPSQPLRRKRQGMRRIEIRGHANVGGDFRRRRGPVGGRQRLEEIQIDVPALRSGTVRPADPHTHRMRARGQRCQLHAAAVGAVGAAIAIECVERVAVDRDLRQPSVCIAPHSGVQIVSHRETVTQLSETSRSGRGDVKALGELSGRLDPTSGKLDGMGIGFPAQMRLAALQVDAPGSVQLPVREDRLERGPRERGGIREARRENPLQLADARRRRRQ